VIRPRPFVAALVGLVSVAALLLLGPLATTSTAAARGTDPLAGAPTVGECHKLTLKGLYKQTDRSRKVRCSRDHTSRVIKVAQLPAGASWSDSDAKLGRIATRGCEPVWKKTLGQSYVSRARSAYSWGWFIPTAGQRDRGARWFSCHVILWGGNRSLVTLPTDKAPALGDLPHPDKVAVCLTRHSFVFTVCARKHSYRATGVFTMDKTNFPGDRAIRRAAIHRCPSRVDSDRFRWSNRGSQRWEMGDHTVVCYSKTRR
jgi:Septum formation